jgi:lysophospholipase L1-like esterase
VGDSITEGVLIDVDYYKGFVGAEPASYIDQNNRVYQDDACATYAWLTAERLNLRPIVMGYGAVGATRAGQGKVPPAAEAYPYNFDGSPITRPEPDYILINHGANDRGHSAEEYTEKYAGLLDVIRKMNPHAKIFALSAFCGGHHEALGKLIEEYNRANGTDVVFIDSTGWIPVEPLHPLRDGHNTVAEHLVPILKELL